MTRVGVITDAHANLPALRAALNALNAAGCEHIVHCGDAIGIGPHPREVVETLLALPHATLLMGNHDALFARRELDDPPSWLSEGELAHQQWTHEQLNESHRDAMSAWPMDVRMTVGDVDISFTHYAHDGHTWAPIVRDNYHAELDAIFRPEAPYVFFGHHHPRADVTGKARYINPGALGCNPSEGARYAIITASSSGIDVVLDAAPYNPSDVYRDLVARGVPDAEFIRRVFWA